MIVGLFAAVMDTPWRVPTVDVSLLCGFASLRLCMKTSYQLKFAETFLQTISPASYMWRLSFIANGHAMACPYRGASDFTFCILYFIFYISSVRLLNFPHAILYHSIQQQHACQPQHRNTSFYHCPCT